MQTTATMQTTPTLDVSALDPPAVLIFNPNAGQKLGLTTNSSDAAAVQAALAEAGIPFEPRRTEYAGHATELARAAVAEGRRLVIAAGGDGTVREVAQALAVTDTVLGVMPLGSVMNTARTLCIPRDLGGAARVIASGRVLAMDLGKVGDAYFLEAAGVGLDAGLLCYFQQLDRRGLSMGILRAMVRFLRRLGTPRLLVEVDGRRREMRAPMISIANGPFVGAAYTVAPDACVDDGCLDVVIFRGLGVLRMLVHLLVIIGGRRLPPPPGTETVRARSVRVDTRRRRPLPVHADGAAVGTTPMRFQAVPGALRVLTGRPVAGEACSWWQAGMG
jgi:YegS/Rv2252/BmrU family lipid kinase